MGVLEETCFFIPILVMVGVAASRVHLSQGTVRNYLSAAIGKTATNSRVEAAQVAQQRGWL